MARYMYVLWRPYEAPLASFRAELLGTRAPALADQVSHLVVSVADQKAPKMGDKRPEDRARVSAVVEFEAASDDHAKALGVLLDEGGTLSAGYCVEHAVVRDYTREWTDGTPSPGAVQMTFLRRKPGLDDDAFVDHWFNTHTPLALSIHPIWRYNRNKVLHAITDGAPDFDGLVGLHFRALDDITNPMRLFGGKMENMQVITEDVSSFIDMPAIVVNVMTEHILKSAQP
ncbi:MAG: EthD domain-containing protein [Myxococcota bacterium]